MPRAKKAAGTAVDRRNGERGQSSAVVRLRRFTLPRRSDDKDYDVRTRRMWASLWADDALSSVLAPVDRELLVRWAQAVDDNLKALETAREDPISKGSMGQEVESPFYKIAAAAMAVVERCEAQIGVGALNRARLGLAVLAERAASLADLAASFPGDGGGGVEPDPRRG